MNSLLTAIVAVCNAYSSYVQLLREREIDDLEDQIDLLAGDGSPAAKLRIERLSQRKARKIKQLGSLRSTDNNTN